MAAILYDRNFIVCYVIHLSRNFMDMFSLLFCLLFVVYMRLQSFINFLTLNIQWSRWRSQSVLGLRNLASNLFIWKIELAKFLSDIFFLNCARFHWTQTFLGVFNSISSFIHHPETYIYILMSWIPSNCDQSVISINSERWTSFLLCKKNHIIKFIFESCYMFYEMYFFNFFLYLLVFILSLSLSKL